MDILFSLLFWIHLTSLGLGGAAVFGIPVVGRKLAIASAETRPLLFSIAHGLSTIGRVAIVLLIITGPLMFWLRYGWVAPNDWFWVKTVLVVLLLGVVIFAGINASRAEKGNREAAMRAPIIGMVGTIVYVAVIAAAVVTFG